MPVVDSVESKPVDERELLESILQRAADELGDITTRVMALHYSRQPRAQAVFSEQASGELSQLEANMVDQALYCLMTWLDRPAEVEVMYMDAVSHHQYLGIPLSVFIDLQTAVVEVVAGVIRESETEARRLMQRVAAGLVGAIENAAEDD